MALLRPVYLDDLNPVFPVDLNAKDWTPRRPKTIVEKLFTRFCSVRSQSRPWPWLTQAVSRCESACPDARCNSLGPSHTYGGAIELR